MTPRNNFVTLGSFAEVSVPLKFIIPCLIYLVCRVVSPLVIAASFVCGHWTMAFVNGFIGSLQMFGVVIWNWLSDIIGPSLASLSVHQPKCAPAEIAQLGER